MTTLPVIPRQTDPAAAEARETFGQLLLLPGLAVAYRDGKSAESEHPMPPAWDARGRLAYACRCGLHTVSAAAADRSAWFAYCVATGTLPHDVADYYQRRALLVKHVAHVYLTDATSVDPVVALGWASFPAVNLT